MSNIFPKVSIITVCYNTEKTIEKTIKSVLEQDYSNIEYIIIDGLSSDRTLEIVNQYKSNIACVISEKDSGVFDAMNKGLEKANGEYIWYLNADDQIYAPNTLSLAMENHKKEDFVYGKAILVNESGVERKHEVRKAHPQAHKLSWRTLKDGMVICHQAMLVKRSIVPKYNLKYEITGDLDWAINVLKRSNSFRDTGLYMCRFVEGGISTVNRKASLIQRFQILCAHYGVFTTVWRHFIFLLKAIKRGTIR
ncbi:MAG: glycosyltransferase [Saprospiraceae bacterium]|nr:glycosyltransferase [Saprospiraceae bacterium]